MKICYITNLLSPYRIEWMNLLAKNNLVESYYINSCEKTRESDWLEYVSKEFSATAVSEISHGKDSSFIDYISQKRYDIYLIDGYSSAIKIKCIFRLLSQGFNVFVNIDGFDLWRKKTVVDIPKDFIKKAVFKSGASFLCGSAMAAKLIIKKGAKKENVYIHPFTSLHKDDIISYEEVVKERKKQKEKLFSPNQKIALAVGRFIPLKHYDTLIKCWVNMPDDYILCLIGGGIERPKYEALLRKNNLSNVRILDYMNPDELEHYYLAADLFIHPSSSETWGLVINEAMAKGLPIITTNRCTAGVELVRNGVEGYVVSVDDISAMEKYVKLLLSDDLHRSKLSRNCIERIKGYTLESLADRHMDIFTERINV